MRDRRIGAMLWAGGLVITGLLLLLLNFDLLERFEPLAQYVVAGAFALVGVGFFGSYLADRRMWWRLIPGWTLLSVAGMVWLSTLPAVSPLLIPVVLFLGLALAFANIYLVNRRENWWAIIPGGFLLVLSAVLALNSVTDDLELLFAILVVGLGLVFLLLSVLGPEKVQWWPLIPGLVLVLFGLFIVSGGSAQEGALLRWWPVILIAIGLGIAWRSVARKPKPESLSVNVSPGLAPAGQAELGASTKPQPAQTGVLGEYLEPAPGASVQILSDGDDD